MRFRLPSTVLALVLGTALPATAQVPGLDIDIRLGVNSSNLSETPTGFDDSNSELGWFFGGDVKFGEFLFIQPGVYYQHQSVDLQRTNVSDGVGVSSIMIPLQAGVDVNLQAVAAELGIGPTFTFNTAVGDNAFGIQEGDLNGTRFGGLVSGKLKVLFVTGWLGYQFDFTDALKGGGANLNQWMFGLGVNF